MNRSTVELKVPSMGESAIEGEIAEWLKNEGDIVNEDETVVILETDKATLEVQPPTSGRLVRILKKKGDQVHVGESLAVIEVGEAIQPATPSVEKSGRDPAFKGVKPPEKKSSPKRFPDCCKVKHPLIRAGVVLGLGFGGFADGIVLHQILGWHHMVCVTEHCRPASIAQLQLQNTQDGFFHLALWMVSLAGTAMLFRAGRRPGPSWNGRVLLGSMLVGWGLFNFIEGIVDHQILGIHHVLPGHAQEFWFDMLFLMAGIVFFVIGARLIRSVGKRRQLGTEKK